MKNPFKNITNKEFERVCKAITEQGIDLQSIDFSSCGSNTTLDILENYLYENYGICINKPLKERAKEVMMKQQQAIAEEERELIKDWKKQKPERVINEFSDLKHLINIVANKTDKKVNGLLVLGESGLAKSYTITNHLKAIGKDFVYFCGKITPLKLYELLYENSHSLIVLDDCEVIFSNEDSVSILKSALQEVNGKRLVFWNSSKIPDFLPKMFEFKGQIIILLNKINRKNDSSVKAVISRTLFYELKLTYKQKMKIFEKIINSRKDLNEKQKKDILRIIKKNTSVATEDLNIRTLEKLIAIYKYDSKKAEKLFRKIIKVNELKAVVLELMESGMSVEEQVKKFEEITGKSRRTYFNIKKEIRGEIDD